MTKLLDCVVPEKLRLWDKCDWSVAPDSLLPFEYGPSSEETTGRYGGAVMRNCGDMLGESAAEGLMNMIIHCTS